MSLQEKLNTLKSKFESTAPKEAVGIMHRVTADLRSSGIVDSALKVGDKVPDFSLKNAEDRLIDSKELLSKGPMVISFYRGKW